MNWRSNRDRQKEEADAIAKRNAMLRTVPLPPVRPVKPGYIRVADLRPSYDRAKIYDKSSGQVITFDDQISFSGGQIQEALKPNQQRAQIMFIAVTDGPFWVRFGSEAKEGFGIPLNGAYSNFIRDAKVSYLYPGGINVWAANLTDVLYILESSFPGIETGEGSPVEFNPGHVNDADGGEFKTE